MFPWSHRQLLRFSTPVPTSCFPRPCDLPRVGRAVKTPAGGSRSIGDAALSFWGRDSRAPKAQGKEKGSLDGGGFLRIMRL